jgi:CAI-1 autoinducer synthase
MASETPIALQSVASGTALAEASEPRYPGWLRSHFQEHRCFIDTLDPFPFDQPSDITPYLSFHQNDYLRLASRPEVIQARAEANSRVRIESFSSSVFGGASDEHVRFSKLLSESLQASGVILTTAGWTANVGLLEAAAPVDCPIYIDPEAHASLGDGIRLSRGRKLVIKHNDPGHLESRIKIHGSGLVCIDAVYSTDGVVPDLEHYVAICERHDCTLVLDEAHSFGMFGENGGGLAVRDGLADRVHFRTISLSKALGGHGGVVAGSQDMIRSLSTCIRPVLFSSATSAVLAAGHAKSLELVMRDPGPARHCQEMAALLRRRLNEAGVSTAGSASQIISLYFKGQDACRFYGELRKRRILTSVFVYPAIPKGISLARFSVYSELSESDIHHTADSVLEVLRENALRMAVTA